MVYYSGNMCETKRCSLDSIEIFREEKSHMNNQMVQIDNLTNASII